MQRGKPVLSKVRDQADHPRFVCLPGASQGASLGGTFAEKDEFIGEPAGTRTQDPVIKSHVLYRLSYGLGAPLHTEKLGAFPVLRP
jgi:hypothetical protein